MFKVLWLVIVSLVLAGVFLGAGCGRSGPSPVPGASAQAAKFHCPMHPTYVSDRQGDCPICGMRLVPIKHGGADTPGLQTATRGEVPGRVAVLVSPEKRQIIGLSTISVERRTLVQSVRTSGLVTHDERLLARVAPRFAGWVRDLEVNYTGQPVVAGQRLFTVYSPEVFTAQNEYLLVLQNVRPLTNALSAARDSANTSNSLLSSARRRLELLEVGDEEIRALEQLGKPADELTFRAPFSGHVVTKNAIAGKSFEAGETLYEIADLGHLWVLASVFESDLPRIKAGQKARVIFPYLGNREFETTITFISPHIDPQTRRGEMRVELDNPQHLLRPDMWANVAIEVDLGEALTIPASAIIDTGTRVIAFVDRADGHLEPREVKLLARTDEYAQVAEGLKEGERVVTRALFLVDSESQLKAAIAGMAAAVDSAHSH